MWPATRARLLTIAIVSAVALVAACGVRGVQIEQSPLLRVLERASGAIAFVDETGNIAVMDQRGGRAAALTTDAGETPPMTVAYGLPTWSPDGGSVAYPGYRSDTVQGELTSWIAVADRAGRETREMYRRGDLRAIYLSWSPDSSMLAILSAVSAVSETGTLELGLAPAARDGEYRALDLGQPYYWDWLPDSRTLVTHVGETRLALLDTSGGSRSRLLDEGPAAFQSPDVSGDGVTLAYVKSVSGGYSVALRELAGGSERLLPADPNPVYLALSSGGNHLAVLHAEGMSPVPYGSLTVVDLRRGGAGKTVVLEGEIVLAFFWSPRGDRLAAVTLARDPATTDPMFLLDPQRLYLVLRGFDAGGGDSWTIAQYPVTIGTLQILPFFDQYHRSLTIWSPDTRSIVFTAYAADGAPSVYVVPADGNVKPRRLAGGDSASWSPR